jgi:hypothetical protein
VTIEQALLPYASDHPGRRPDVVRDDTFAISKEVKEMADADAAAHANRGEVTGLLPD